MKLLLLVAILATAFARVQELDAQNEFTSFVGTFAKKYDTTAEFFKRFNIFKDNLEFISQHNSENHTYTLGVNEFTDLSHEEFVATYVGKLNIDASSVPPTLENVLPEDAPVPNDIDWRSRGAVNPVRNQGSCGSCWAFAAIAAIEGAVKVNGKPLPQLSEQQLVDCSGSAGNKGCAGGLPAQAINWAARNGGVCSSSSYPYAGRDQRCNTGCTKAATTGGANGVGASDSGLTNAINGRPVAVAIVASGRAFQSYSSGVFSGPCPGNLDHAVTAVGFTGQAYIVRNSWGSSWGQGGYIMMARPQNTCGIQNSWDCSAK
jgi:C1A family cysteine protease